MKNAVVLGLLTFVLGCSSDHLTSYPHGSFCSQNALTKQFCSKGAQPSSIAKLIFIGSEADVGRDIRVTVTDRQVFQTVWDSISNATEYGSFYACGWRTIEFYSEQNSGAPLATLLVFCGSNDNGNVYIEGMDPWKSGRGWLYVCKGLHGVVMKHLQEEYDRRHKDSTP